MTPILELYSSTVTCLNFVAVHTPNSDSKYFPLEDDSERIMPNKIRRM